MIITSISKPKRGRTLSKEINKAQESLFQFLQVTCHLCAHPYNSTDQTPIMICPQQHTYCSKCVTDLFSHHPYGTRCPTCRVYICQKGTQVNKSILRICDRLPLLASKYANLQIQKQQLETKLEQVHKLFQRKRLVNITLQGQKENIDCSNKTNQNTKRLPSISHRQPNNKDQKINIHSYLARRRKLSAQEKVNKQNNPYSITSRKCID